MEKAGFNTLKKTIKPITSRVLALRLNDLVTLKMIVKEIVNQRPLRVEYYLTEKGKAFLEALTTLIEEHKKEEIS